MKNKIVYLYWNTIKIAELTYVNNEYWYRIINNNLSEAQRLGCQIDYLYVKNESYYNITETLPYIFERFTFIESRDDLMEEYGILNIDNEFERLYKVACKPELLYKNNFWISTK